MPVVRPLMCRRSDVTIRSDRFRFLFPEDGNVRAASAGTVRGGWDGSAEAVLSVASGIVSTGEEEEEEEEEEGEGEEHRLDSSGCFRFVDVNLRRRGAMTAKLPGPCAIRCHGHTPTCFTGAGR